MEGRGNPAHRGAVLKTDAQREFAGALIAQLPTLRRYAVALSGSVANGDDLVQDCIERALKQSDRLRDRQKLGGWLRSILHNLYIDELRRKRSRGIEEDITELADNFAISVPPSDRAPFHEFTAAMATLSAEHREILLLVGLDGMNYREIAEALHIPIGTVMSRLARARERLRNALESGSERATASVASLDERRKIRQ
ncbi:MAG TPA: RNA polymerase sigma factor [Rhizomicrobium sp.]|nr:RNA polymerase sigma factor [Rhizomicrobium sp.]